MVPLKVVAAPAVVWAVISMVWLASAALGIPRGFDGRAMTLSEASAVASHADVERLLRSGADPNARARLRAGLVRNRAMDVTPLEAATGAIRTGPVEMLVEHGARIDASNYAVLWCAAKARNNQDMIRFLRSPNGLAPPADCAGVPRIW